MRDHFFLKVRCVGNKDLNNVPRFTVGKTYEWVDGILESDTGFKYNIMVQGPDPKKWILSDYYDFEIIEEDDAPMEYKIRIMFRDFNGRRQIVVFDNHSEAYRYVSIMAAAENGDDCEILAVFYGENTSYSSLMTEKSITWEDLVGFFA